MDLLESGAEAVPLRERLRAAQEARPPVWAVLVLALVVLATLAGGGLAARDQRAVLAQEAARVDVDVLPAGVSSSTVGGVARGSLSLLLVNRQDRRVRLGALAVAVEGMRVLDVEPVFGQPLAGLEERLFRIGFVVPSCDALVLPGEVRVSMALDGGPLQRLSVPVRDPTAAGGGGGGGAGGGSGGFTLGACPDSARGEDPGTPTDVAVRSAGGRSEPVGAGVEGFARLEVRNAGVPVQLLSVDAVVPGVVFTPRLLDGGRTLATEEVVVVRLGFRVPDCGLLQRTGRLVLRIERFDGVQEVGLRLTAEPEAGAGPEVDLRVVLDACR